MFQTEVVEKIKTHILCSITFFFLENLAVYMIKVLKYSTAGQATDDDTAHAHCVLDCMFMYLLYVYVSSSCQLALFVYPD